MAARKPPEINASSTADIAFLLLIFFLVTTTMDVDTGIARTLPPPVTEKLDIKVKERNVFTVLINSGDQILVNGEVGNIRLLRTKVKEFLTPYYSGNPTLPSVDGHPEVKLEVIEGIGDYYKSQGVVSMQNDRGTSYKIYIQVQNELAAAVMELRDEVSKKYFGIDFKTLLEKDEEKAKSIQKAVPMSISEAEPVSLGD